MTSSHSYHCLCSTFILATNYDLASLPCRRGSALDEAIIARLQEPQGGKNSHTIVQNIVVDQQPTIVRREDGFEKRFLLRCQRCNLIIGYHLDKAQFKEESHETEDFAYLLPGALLPTEDMMQGKVTVPPEWAQQKM